MWSGHSVSKEKSSITFASYMSPTRRRSLLRMMGFVKGILVLEIDYSLFCRVYFGCRNGKSKKEMCLFGMIGGLTRGF
ncbi:hypothetical protein I3842_02G061900 [Carya illinoinensis]|uniref:Uncharacterized protein n=1 Tax=Carya illinoinensis TaxID=32201 RepID=A0A922JZP0_CARIL|nr:hypothetical protein I3842_02G061900 [Carya illinoinensis]